MKLIPTAALTFGTERTQASRRCSRVSTGINCTTKLRRCAHPSPRASGARVGEMNLSGCPSYALPTPGRLRAPTPDSAHPNPPDGGRARHDTNLRSRRPPILPPTRIPQRASPACTLEPDLRSAEAARNEPDRGSAIHLPWRRLGPAARPDYLLHRRIGTRRLRPAWAAPLQARPNEPGTGRRSDRGTKKDGLPSRVGRLVTAG